jgi:predicted TIM-barrel fold metal-dependent hydrolase
VYLETSLTWGYLDQGKLVEMARAHGINRVMFGTDSPWQDQSASKEALLQSGLEDEELEQIFGQNARTLLRFGG